MRTDWHACLSDKNTNGCTMYVSIRDVQKENLRAMLSGYGLNLRRFTRISCLVLAVSLLALGVSDGICSPVETSTESHQSLLPSESRLGSPDILHSVTTPKRQVMISAPREGVLANVYVQEGQLVEKDQLPAQLPQQGVKKSVFLVIGALMSHYI